jgi:demethylmenaquinone methyltransferase/2-methoxy-6-polyprenyl-1,4-benzoquinol methylase/phosphoethanolamine N-methyltransferase
MHGRNHSHAHIESAPITQGRTIRWANHYDLFVKLVSLGRENTLRRQTIQEAAIARGETVLDVGCGTGTLTLMAKAETGNSGVVFGIDASPEMVAVARQKAAQQGQDVDFQTALIEKLPFSDGTFDAVLSSMMFHHLPDDLKVRGLKEIYRVLQPGGRLVVVDMKRPTTLIQRLGIMTLAHHQLTTDVRDLPPLMEEIGFVGNQSGSMSWSALGFVRGSRAI